MTLKEAVNMNAIPDQAIEAERGGTPVASKIRTNHVSVHYGDKRAINAMVVETFLGQETQVMGAKYAKHGNAK